MLLLSKIVYKWAIRTYWSILDEAYLIDEWTNTIYQVVIFLPSQKHVTLRDTVQSFFVWKSYAKMETIYHRNKMEKTTGYE